ncbi:4'-phosphopantetheinyl transferase superfamily protein [bacterium]|nr:4'-phosphopantetheinyl transferase superfamily protein [bacterium]
MQTLVYIANTESLKENGLYNAAFDAVSAERKDKVLRYRFLKDRVLSLGAELLLRKALRECGIEIPEIRYGFETDGKPFIKGLEDFNFNISHSEDLVMVAVSENETGCDIEKITETDLDIAKKFFFREEYENIAALPASEERNELFFRYWTLKESFMKATGLGMRLPLDSFQILIGNDGKTGVRQSVDTKNYNFTEIHAFPGYKCAVCTAGNAAETDVKIVDFRKILNGGNNGGTEDHKGN